MTDPALKTEPAPIIRDKDTFLAEENPFEAMMERLEDIELNAIADARKEEPRIKVDIDAI